LKITGERTTKMWRASQVCIDFTGGSIRQHKLCNYLIGINFIGVTGAMPS
jgi:hypothetical protein